MSACHDCDRPYGAEHGFPDLLIPDAQWREVSPSGDEGGLLCPSCICKRLYDAGVTDCPGAFMSGPIRTEPTGAAAVTDPEYVERSARRHLRDGIVGNASHERAVRALTAFGVHLLREIGLKP